MTLPGRFGSLEEVSPSTQTSSDSDLVPTPIGAEIVVRDKNSARNSSDAFFIRSWVLEKAENSRVAYLRISSEYLKFIEPRSLQKTELSDLQNFLEIKTHHSKATQAQRRAVLKSLYSFGLRTGYLPANLGAFLKSVRLESKLTNRYLTEEEVQAMLRLTENPRDRALLRLLYSGGLRVSECVGLSWEDFQEKNPNPEKIDGSGGGGGALVKVEGKGEKTRVVLISPATWEEIKALRSEKAKPAHAVFQPNYEGSSRLGVRQVVNIVKQAALRAGISKAVSPHWLRHAHASHALDRGAPIHLVQATLGHASIATTGKYLHARPQESSGGYLDV
jgi:integrase/recombinase XerD